jgi:hypothetical protein
MQTLTISAIQAALNNDWTNAVSINEDIIKEKADDLEALSRLAYAFIRLGKPDRAKRLYRKILSLDAYNSMARKNLDKLNSLPKNASVGSQKSSFHVSPGMFIEEPGKTKSVTLINPAPVRILTNICIGEFVTLYPKKHSVEVRRPDKTYIGALPDDIAFRLIRFLSGGNSYEACIKSIHKNNVSIFIRETARGKKYKDQPSFIGNSKDFPLSFTPREIKNALSEEDENSPDQEEENEE